MSFTAPYRAGASDAFALPSRQGNNFAPHRAPMSLASSAVQSAHSTTAKRKPSPLDGTPFTTKQTKSSMLPKPKPKADEPMKKPPASEKEVRLVVSRDPYPGRREMPPGKYSRLFDGMSAGDCLKDEPEKIPSLANRLRDHVSRFRAGSGLVVRSAATYIHPKTGENDGLGRVWLLAGEAK